MLERQKGAPLPVEDRERLQCLIAEHGARRMSRELGLSAQTIVRASEGGNLHAATAVVLRLKLVGM